MDRAKKIRVMIKYDVIGIDLTKHVRMKFNQPSHSNYRVLNPNGDFH